MDVLPIEDISASGGCGKIRNLSHSDSGHLIIILIGSIEDAKK